ncbi:MAG: hypothetical protein ABI091_03320 [Ferruginibacter sp.]
MKKQILTLSLLFIFIGCHAPEKPFRWSGYETSDTNYFNGQILPPDYVHENILVVVNADSINWCMENYNIAGDGDILDVLNAYCEPLPSIP